MMLPLYIAAYIADKVGPKTQKNNMPSRLTDYDKFEPKSIRKQHSENINIFLTIRITGVGRA